MAPADFGPPLDAGTPDRDAALPVDAEAPDPDAAPGCPPGTACNPIVIDRLPFTDDGDTRDAPAAAWNRYACAPDTDEGGGEVIYALDLDAPATVRIEVDDMPGDGVDVDVHLLSAADPAACIARDNRAVERALPAGRAFIAVDTWVGAEQAFPGPYRLTVSARTAGSCAVRMEDVRMAWASCDPSLDCYEGQDANGQRARFLRLPATGPVVLEAHLVTVEDAFPGGWPAASRDGIAAHYALSQATSGYAMDRREPWAPEGEGGSRWGQSAYSRPLPVLDEAWYVNMYWSPAPRPAPG
ncbi:MAG: hypothetical protein R3F60_19255 [bacterium]